MSGGHFDYNQYRINDIAYGIERLIATNDDATTNEYGERKGFDFPPEVIERFKEAVHTLYQASDMVRRVDWLVGGDDGVESFKKRWEKEVRPYWTHKCQWSQDDDGNWSTQCEDMHVFITGGPTENNHHFCPYCGGKILIQNP